MASTTTHPKKNISHVGARVMRRVWWIWLSRRIMPVVCLECVVLASVALGAQWYVSFAHVLENASARMPAWSLESLGAFFRYVASAFMGTEFITHVFVLAGVLTLGFLARDMVRLFKCGLGNIVKLVRVT